MRSPRENRGQSQRDASFEVDVVMRQKAIRFRMIVWPK